MAIPNPVAGPVAAKSAVPPECHLARVQLRRYLAGDVFPEALLADLSAHLAGCPDCKAEGERVRDALGTVVAGGASPAGPPSQAKWADMLQAFRNAPGDRLVAALKAPRTVALSIALSVVLVLLTTVFRSPTGLLGPKAAAVEEPAAEKPEKSGKARPEAKADDEEVTAVATDKDPEGGHAATEEGGDRASGDKGHAASSAEDGHGAKPAASEEKPDRVETAFTQASGEVVVARPAARPPAKPAPSQARQAKPKAKPSSRRPARQAPARPSAPATSPEPYVKVYPSG